LQISIIIPTLNEGGSLPLLLSHLKSVTADLQNISEIIVVDGGSRDNTISVAKNSPAKIIKSQVARRSYQLHLGALEAKGEILYFLHADSFPPRYFDKLIISAINEKNCFGCFRMKFDSSKAILNLYGWFTQFKPLLFRGGDQSLFIRKEDYLNSGGFNESLEIMEDIEIIRRGRKNLSFKILSEEIITSARKYRKNGFIRLQLVFGFIHLLYFSGFKQSTILKLYKRFIRT
jgi:rSAM/selenodomain-associated transferase 2